MSTILGPDRPDGGVMAEGMFGAVIGGSPEPFFFGDVWALLPVVLWVESLLRPRAIAVAAFRFSFSTLADTGVMGEGEGRGKAELLLRGTRVVTFVGFATAFEGGVRPLTMRPVPTLLPHPAEFGSAADTTVSSAMSEKGSNAHPIGSSDVADLGQAIFADDNAGCT